MFVLIGAMSTLIEGVLLFFTGSAAAVALLYSLWAAYVAVFTPEDQLRRLRGRSNLTYWWGWVVIASSIMGTMWALGAAILGGGWGLALLLSLFVLAVVGLFTVKTLRRPR